VLLGLGAVGPVRSRLPDCGLAIGAFAFGALITAAVLVRWTQPDELKDLKFGTLMETPFAVAFTVLWFAFQQGGPPWAEPAMLLNAACAL
jgi:hypothetical protein